MAEMMWVQPIRFLETSIKYSPSTSPIYLSTNPNLKMKVTHTDHVLQIEVTVMNIITCIIIHAVTVRTKQSIQLNNNRGSTF